MTNFKIPTGTYRLIPAKTKKEKNAAAVSWPTTPLRRSPTSKTRSPTGVARPASRSPTGAARPASARKSREPQLHTRGSSNADWRVRGSSLASSSASSTSTSLSLSSSPFSTMWLSSSSPGSMSSSSSDQEQDLDPASDTTSDTGALRRYKSRKLRQRSRKALFPMTAPASLSSPASPASRSIPACPASLSILGCPISLFIPASEPAPTPTPVFSLPLSATAAPFKPTAPAVAATDSSAASPKTDVVLPGQGKLRDLCGYLFCQAYGLQGVHRRDHEEVIRDAISLTGCSTRAIQEVLYGHSYQSEIAPLRLMVPDFPSKVRCRSRKLAMENVLSNLHHMPLATFDANTLREQRERSSSSDFDFEESTPADKTTTTTPTPSTTTTPVDTTSGAEDAQGPDTDENTPGAANAATDTDTDTMRTGTLRTDTKWTSLWKLLRV